MNKDHPSYIQLTEDTPSHLSDALARFEVRVVMSDVEPREDDTWCVLDSLSGEIVANCPDLGTAFRERLEHVLQAVASAGEQDRLDRLTDLQEAVSCGATRPLIPEYDGPLFRTRLVDGTEIDVYSDADLLAQAVAARSRLHARRGGAVEDCPVFADQESLQ